MEKLSKFKEVTRLKEISKELGSDVFGTLSELGLPVTDAKVELIARLTMVDPERLAQITDADATNAMTIESEDEPLPLQRGDIADNIYEEKKGKVQE